MVEQTGSAVSYEATTRGGFRLEINPARMSCIVFSGGRAELPRNHVRGLDGNEQLIPSMLFVGSSFELFLRAGEIALANNRNFKLQVPFRFAGELDWRSMNVGCPTQSDQFPILIYHYPNLPELFAQGTYVVPQYVVAQSGFGKLDMVRLHARFPRSRMMVARHPRDMEQELAQELQNRTHSEAQVERELGQPEDLSTNAVFLARIFLRRLELEKVRRLLLDFDISEEEIEFVRTFVQVMIRNEGGRREIFLAQSDLERLDELYRLYGVLQSGDRNSFDAELDQGVDSEVASYLVPLVARRRKSATEKEDEIYFWEWEYRLSEMASG